MGSAGGASSRVSWVRKPSAARQAQTSSAVSAKKKYRFLAYAYRILLAGLVLSFLAFVAPYVGVKF